MNAPVHKLKPEAELIEVDPLAKLREPFPDNLISKLPKPYKKDSPKGNCTVCGGYHGLPAAHLDYVGHAALTHRLLDVDPHWSWEPVAFRDGLPAFDQTGGLWIRLTICGVTRLGYGHAAPKANMDPGSREKEVIGDALRNAAMRFGAALDLWHKGDLHAETDAEPMAHADELAINLLQLCRTKGAFKEAWEKNKDGWKKVMDEAAYARVVAVMKERAAIFTKTPTLESKPVAAPDDFGIGEDEIPF